MSKTETNEIAVEKLNNIYIGLIVFVLVDIVLIIVGERPKGQGFLEYCAWTTVGLGNLIILVIAFLWVLGWAVG